MFTKEEEDFLSLLQELNLKRQEYRRQEFEQIFSLAEDHYLNEKFQLGLILTGFAISIAEKSNLTSKLQKAQLLEKKFKRSLKYLQDLDDLNVEKPIESPPIYLQKQMAKLEAIWEEIQGESERKDSIHKNVIQQIATVRKKLSTFMEKHNIERIDLLDLESKSFWKSTKTSIDLKSNEIRYNRLINSANKAESLSEAQNELEKAYKIIQENPLHFSIQKRDDLIQKIEITEEKIKNLDQKSGELVNQVKNLISGLNFEKAHDLAQSNIEKFEKNGITENIPELEHFIRVCDVNRGFYERLQEIEKIYSNNDILGAKTEFIKFQEEFSSLPNHDLITSELENYIDILRSKITGQSVSRIGNETFDPFHTEKLAPKSPVSFPQKDLVYKFKEIMDSHTSITKEELAETLDLSKNTLFEKLIDWKEKFSFEVDGDVIYFKNSDHLTEDAILNHEGQEKDDFSPEQETPKENKEVEISTSEKEKEALDALDEILDEDF